MEQFPCTCGGDNPTCFRCDGTGMASKPTAGLRSSGKLRSYLAPLSNDSKGASQSARTASPARSNRVSKPAHSPKFGPSSLNICKLCGLSFESGAAYLAHVRTQHRHKDVQTQRVTPPKKTKAAKAPDLSLALCSICNSRVQDLEKHINKKHSPQAERLKLIKQAKKAQQEARRHELEALKMVQTQRLHAIRRTFPQAKLCGFCKEILETDARFVAHMQQKHDMKFRVAASALHTPKVFTLMPDQQSPSDRARKAGTPRLTQKGASYIAKPSNRASSDRHTSQPRVDPFTQELVDRKMDATFGMGGFARDHGRFGSASSYDGMDDESDP
jgi:hypothetical protein